MVERRELGYECHCGHWNPCQSGWAAAHWSERLLHKCVSCGKRNEVQNGRVIEHDVRE